MARVAIVSPHLTTKWCSTTVFRRPGTALATLNTVSSLAQATWYIGVRSWHILRVALVQVLLLGAIAVSAGVTTASDASAETRSLKLYYIHTKEKAEIVYKRNGRYDQSGLNKLNRFLRDWRRNEPTKMDPRLFDLVWEVYNQVGARDYINVVSAYRSPATNDMLRRTRGGQAKKSQHMLGKAMDFYIPGVKLTKLRAAAMKMQGGGVGYYPKSGSPFVHLDVAGVRAWPRMSRQELVSLFPDGKTLHLPPDGKPLPGYKTAMAEYKKRGGAIVSSGGGNSSSNSKRSGGLLAALFGGGDEDEEPDAIASAPVPKPAPPQTEIAALPGVLDAPATPAAVETAFALPVQAPIPVARPVIEPQQPIVVAALAPPDPGLPEQSEINAFAAAANVDVAEPQPIDLASIRAPVPQLLAERAAGGPVEDVPAAVEVAALPVPNLIKARMQVEATEQVAQDQQIASALVDRAAETAPSATAQIAALTAEAVGLPAGEDFVPLPIQPARRSRWRQGSVESAAECGAGVSGAATAWRPSCELVNSWFDLPQGRPANGDRCGRAAAAQLDSHRAKADGHDHLEMGAGPGPGENDVYSSGTGAEICRIATSRSTEDGLRQRLCPWWGPSAQPVHRFRGQFHQCCAFRRLKLTTII